MRGIYVGMSHEPLKLFLTGETAAGNGTVGLAQRVDRAPMQQRSGGVMQRRQYAIRKKLLLRSGGNGWAKVAERWRHGAARDNAAWPRWW